MTAVLPSVPARSPSPLESLDVHILESERVRASILAAIFAILLVGFGVLSTLRPAFFTPMLRSPHQWPVYMVILAGIVAFELGLRALAGRLLARGRRPPPAWRYVTAFVETSVPTLLLLYLLQVFPPAYALAMPPVLGYLLFIFLATLSLDVRVCIFSGTVAALEYAALAAAVIANPGDVAFDPILVAAPQHVAKAGFLFLAGGVAAFVAHQLRRQFHATLAGVEERAHILQLFGQHVSPAVAEELLARRHDPEPEVRDVCVMFLDIRDFTRFAAGRSPVVVVRYLDGTLGPMVELVNRHGGIVNKFLGDGFMAIFGAPLPDAAACEHAVAAALAILEGTEGGATRVGIGLHAGPVVTGTVGPPERKEYTIIGDTVNVASRLEGLNKEYGSQLLVSEAVYASLPQPPQPVSVHDATIKGRSAPLRVVRLR